MRGFDDPDALRLPNGRSVFYPSNPDGYLLPYRLNTMISAVQAIPSNSHAWPVQRSAWDGGKISFPTYPERLTEAGVSWKCYYTPGAVTGLAPCRRWPSTTTPSPARRSTSRP